MSTEPVSRNSKKNRLRSAGRPAEIAVLDSEIEILVHEENELNAQIERQRLDRADRTISPVKGVVDRVFVEEGEYVTPGQRFRWCTIRRRSGSTPTLRKQFGRSRLARPSMSPSTPSRTRSLLAKLPSTRATSEFGRDAEPKR